ncbi:leukocyte immunoglobulin-like receptor subfamily B member 4 isoform X1 [Erinaceus europaeus]|uniref:Leukocyte immunoglobulin-like receptor subfamily B member 4 isoform X1 n=1 Tax=Erinaceus europaeus TaxID=9365 RepID=A0ABM3W4U9_ERIEU|nr:leukocyte immunoglobulin-like receptor subfamily B member 4 isoform X1 [Erinaceus europaeus]
MGGSPIWTLTALLCLGLCRGLWDQVQAGTLSKPSIWAEPGAVIPKGSQVTLWCEGSLQAGGFCLHKDGGSAPHVTKVLQVPSNKTGFSINSVTEFRAGLYQCSYLSSNMCSERSEPLALVVTGVLPPPSLSAHPSPVVEAGGRVTLSCSSETASGTFHLLKEGGADPHTHKMSTFTGGKSRAQFLVGPVTSSHGGTYRCYASYNNNPQVWSQPSNPLHLKVTGHQGPLVSLPALIGILVAVLLLLSLLLLLSFLFGSLHHQGEHRLLWAAGPEPQDRGLQTSAVATPQEDALSERKRRSSQGDRDAAEAETRPEEGAQLDCRVSPAPAQDKDLPVPTLTAVPCPSPASQLSDPALLQAAASTAPQDVTYAQLTLRQGTVPPSSWSEDPPEEPSLYAALATQ